MEQYISKSAVVTEIRHLQLCTMDEHMNYYSSKAKAEYDILNELLLHLDNLEVKEVNDDKRLIKATEWLSANLHRYDESIGLSVEEFVERFKKAVGK